MVGLTLLVVFGIGGAMAWALFNTTVKHGEQWRERAKSREEIEREEPARRGNIYSSDGKVLATTVPVCDLLLDLGHWPKKENGKEVIRKGKVVMESCITNDSSFIANLNEVCRILHEQFPNKSKQYYYDRIYKEYKKSKPSRCFCVERRVPYSQWESIRQMEGWEKCVVTKTSEGSVIKYVRAHIYGNLGENTIGLHYKTPKEEGYTGLEGYYDSVLRGQDGLYRCRRLTLGIWLPEDPPMTVDIDSTLLHRREDGKSIVSTLDTRYQDIAESALRSSMRQFGGQRGCAILMEKETGYVLACCNLTLDTSGALSENLWSNVAVSDRYEPGSTFKTVAMLSMLNDKRIALDTSKRVRAGGQKNYSNTSGAISDDHGYATDTSNLAGVLAKSSNIGMCELAWTYYRDRRTDMVNNIKSIFPFGKIDPDLKVQQYNTSIKKLESDRDFLVLNFGYSVTVTPLQLIAFYNAIANDGCMVKPLFCREILDGRHRSEMKPVILNDQICSPETAKQMREMLRGVVEHGTGSNIRNTVYGIAGKTGTTFKVGDKSIKNSSFVGFFPADNPRYTCLVLVEQTSIAGREAAAPVFKKIADCVMAFDRELSQLPVADSGRVLRPILAKGNRPQLERAHQLLGLPFTMSDTVSNSLWAVYDSEREGYYAYTAPTGVVPDCHGMTIRDAMMLLRSVGLKVQFSGQGKVASQSPKARTAVKKGATITLKLEP